MIIVIKINGWNYIVLLALYTELISFCVRRTKQYDRSLFARNYFYCLHCRGNYRRMCDVIVRVWGVLGYLPSGLR